MIRSLSCLVEKREPRTLEGGDIVYPGEAENAHMAYRNGLGDNMGRLWGDERLRASHGGTGRENGWVDGRRKEEGTEERRKWSGGGGERTRENKSKWMGWEPTRLD